MNSFSVYSYRIVELLLTVIVRILPFYFLDYMKKYCLVCVQLLPVPVHLISDQYWHHTKGVRSHQSSLGVLKTIRGKGEKTWFWWVFFCFWMGEGSGVYLLQMTLLPYLYCKLCINGHTE